jgi:hypothetical protein
VERVSGAVPFVISDQHFNETWITVDGIYPQYSRFVRGVKEPITQRDKRYTKWQEATRKDIERAFVVLKGTWQFLDRPILLMDLEQISLRVTTCTILHNILVSDRMMGQCGVVYNPSHILQENENEVAPARGSSSSTGWWSRLCWRFRCRNPECTKGTKRCCN